MRLSVIVGTYNRSYAITNCLDSIEAALDYAAPLEAEIVVVDNASTDDTVAVISTWAARSKWPVCLERERKKGIAAARNRGLGAAKGSLLIITDDDCRLSLTHVAEALAYDAADSGPVLRGGRVELGDPADLPLTTLTRNKRERWSRRDKSARRYNLGNSLLGCNMAMRRSVVDLIGTFDEKLGSGTKVSAGEDTDYIFRAYLAGLPIEYVPDMGIYHDHGRRDQVAAFKLLKSYSHGSGALYFKYILKDFNLCRQFYWDLKSALREILNRKGKFIEDIEYSHLDKIRHALIGVTRYITTG